MKPIPGPPPTDIGQLLRAEDRSSFVYLERCIVHRDGNAITATDERGTVHIPAATIGALLLGPGTNVSHQAVCVLADSGSTAVWVGERGVRYYAHGRGLSTSSRLMEAQATSFSSPKRRMAVARAMYEMRFPDEDVSALTMQQLRGREGARVRQMYRDAAQEYGVDWDKRRYAPDDFSSGNPVNQALSSATTCLYGITHAVIVAIGCSPALGFVHVGNARSFVFDIAHLYKAEIAVPAAFSIAAEGLEDDDIGALTRRRVRDLVHDGRILSRCARDIRRLLLGPEQEDAADFGATGEWDVVQLWDGDDRRVAGGQNHTDIPW